MRRTSLLRTLLVVTLALAGCGGDDGTTATTTTGGAATTVTAPRTTTAPSPTTATTAPAPTTTSPTATTAPAATLVSIAVAGGEVEGPETAEVALGEDVVLSVTADVADEVHLHGYDLRVATVPGSSVDLSFIADVPGIFEVELEDAGLPLLELTVR